MNAPSPNPTPSQDDRLLAVAAHLSFLVGFPLLAPIAVFLIKRQESRFIAFHALQAAIAHAIFLVAVIVAVILFALIAVVGATTPPVSSHLAGVAFAGVLEFIVLLVAGLVLLIVQLIAAMSAWEGNSWPIPFAGAIARTIIGADEGAAKP